MGHRANYVTIREGEAKAFEDQWGAMGAVYAFADGPEAAVAMIREAECRETDELMDWAFAEGGYLIDFDRKHAIAFGEPTVGDLLDLSEEFGELEDSGGGDALAEIGAVDKAFDDGPLAFLELIAPKWPGWFLCWDDRGVDAFAAWLRDRKLLNIKCQPDSHPEDSKAVEFQA